MRPHYTPCVAAPTFAVGMGVGGSVLGMQTEGSLRGPRFNPPFPRHNHTARPLTLSRAPGRACHRVPVCGPPTPAGPPAARPLTVGATTGRLASARAWCQALHTRSLPGRRQCVCAHVGMRGGGEMPMARAHHAAHRAR